MMLVMVKEADLNRVRVPENYEVLDATALGRAAVKSQGEVLSEKRKLAPDTGISPGEQRGML